MRTRRMLFQSAALAVVALVAAGCQDSPLTAGSDWSMTLLGNPGAIVFDPNIGATAQDVDLLASLVNSKGVPQTGVSVYFAATVPGLTSGANGVKTDNGGIAHTTLKVTSDTATSDITVTATSGSLKQTLTIKVSTTALNLPPVASIVASPKTEQAVKQSVVFDGTSSTDPNKGGAITMYKWVITSTNPDPKDIPNLGDAAKPNPIIAEGPAASGISFPGGDNDRYSAFRNIQELTVALYVTNDPNAPAQFASHIPIAYRGSQIIQYSIVAASCTDNTAPTAVIAGPPTLNAVGLALSTISVPLDGSLSSDPETPIDTYTFNCGNNTSPVPTTSAAKVTCRYLVDTIPHTYTATLVVRDRGTGVLDPTTGTYPCQKQSNPASVQVVISPTTVP